MSHLTTREVLEIVDGTIANGERTKLLLHLEQCSRCRSEVDFQKSLERTAKDLPLTKPQRPFTGQVLGRVLPRTGKSWVSRIVNNLGSILAMGLVLSIVWYAINNSPASDSGRQPSVLSEAFKVYADYYSKAQTYLAKESSQLTSQPANSRAPKTDNVIILTAVSLLILIAIDRFVVQRVMKTRT